MDNLALKLGWTPRDRGVRIDLEPIGGEGFRWLEFWRSTKRWKIISFSPDPRFSGEAVLHAEGVMYWARRAINKPTVIVE